MCVARVWVFGVFSYWNKFPLLTAFVGAHVGLKVEQVMFEVGVCVPLY